MVDAIDFLFTGDISRLTGESTGDVSVKNHGPHVGYTPSDAIVSTILQDDKGNTFTVSRSVADKNSINIPAEYRAQFEELSKNASNGAHFLSRRQLLQYILTTPTKRSEQIWTLLDIADLKNARDVFVKLAKKTKTAAKVAKEKYDSNVVSLRNTLGIDDNNQLLDSINKYRFVLGGNPLTSLDTGPFISGLTFSDTQNESLASILTKLESFCEYLPGYISTIEQCVTAVEHVIIKIGKEEGTIADKKSIALVKAGIELLSGKGTCPLCLAQWVSEDELKAFLVERRRKGETISSLLDEFSMVVNKLDSEVQKYKLLLTSLIAQTQKIDDKKLHNPILQTALDDLSVFSNLKSLTVDSFSQKIMEMEQYQKKFVLDHYLKELNGLVSKIKPLIDSQSQLRANAWQKLNSSTNLYAEKIKYELRKPIYQATLKKADELLKEYEAAQEEQLNNLFQSISDRFAVFYKTMHNEDEGDFSVLLENAKSGMSINVDFHGLGQYPPMAYHSEGHQDTMGIGLFFALMESLTAPNFEVVVLDDVVMSVDIEHRKNFCKVLNDFFGNRQFIITTHDQVWARHLIDSGVVPRKNYVHFSSWSVDAGPMISIGHDVWNLAKKKAEVHLNEASAFLRREMECFFENVCDKLLAKLPYNSAHRWDFGQYMNAAHSTLKEQYATAKKHAQKYSNSELITQISSIEETMKVSRKTLDSENWVTNALVHYNPQYIISKSEFLSAVDAMRSFASFFQCTDCQTPLYLTFDGLRPSTLRCRCSKNMFSL